MCALQTHIRLSNGVELPRVGLGTFRSQGDHVTAAVSWALTSQIQHIDTASIYKVCAAYTAQDPDSSTTLNPHLQNETDLQTALAGQPRGEIFITSKLSPYEQGTEKATQACQQILKRLQIDSIDLLLIHWPGAAHLALNSELHAQLRLQTWRVLEKIYSAGRCRAIGVSNYCQSHLEELLLVARIKPMVNQVEVHPRYPQLELRSFCQQNNIAVVAYSSLGVGDLLNYANIVQIATDCDCTSAQVLLRWALQQGCAVIPKSLNQVHIAEATPHKLLNWELNPKQMKMLNDMNDGHKYCWDPQNVL